MLAAGLGLGGSERQLFYFLSNIDREKFAISIINFTPEQNYFVNAIKKLDIKIFSISPDLTSKWRKFLFIRKIAKQSKSQIIHAWSFHLNPYVSLVNLLSKNRKSIGSLRSAWNSNVAKGIPTYARFLQKYFLDKMVVNSKLASEELIKNGFARRKIIYIPNSIDASRFEYSGQKQNENCFTIGIIGNFRAEKNHQFFVEIIHELVRKNINCKAVIVGQTVRDQPDILPQLEQTIRELNIRENIENLGFRDDISEIFRQLDVLVVPSLYEGTPNVILEAMSARVPVVASAVGGIPGIIEHECTGLLFPLNNLSEAVSCVERIISESDFAQKITQNAHLFVSENFNFKKTTQMYEKLYRTVVEK